MSYSGRGGHYWDKSADTIISRGEYYLIDDSAAEFGEPIILIGTGIAKRGFNQRPVRSYDESAGTVKALGVSVEWRANVKDYTDEDYALLGTHDMKRDLSILLKGSITIKNMGSGDIEAGDTVVPVDGGCEKMETSGQYSLGQAKQKIPSLKRGLVFVNPDFEKPTI
jgi:hypothetical protein